MRAIARQSARLANGTGVRQASRARRLNAALTTREFHQAPSRLAQDPSSNNRPDQPSPTSTLRSSEEQRKRDAIASVEAEEQGVNSGEVNNGDDVRKPLARKTLRQRRNAVDAVPAPPPVPDWFLKYNVKLCVEQVKQGKSKKAGSLIRCVDADTGHVLFTLPGTFVAATTQDERSKMAPATRQRDAASPCSGISSPDPSAEGNFFSYRSGATREPATTIERKDAVGAVESTNGPIESAEQSSESPKNALNESERVTDEISNEESGKTGAAQENVSLDDGPPHGAHEILRQILLEAELGIRAGMAAVADSHRLSSFAASRVDLSLICPDANSHDQMDEIVESLATLTNSDLIRLDVNDLAELTSEFVGRDSDLPGSFSSLGYDVYEGFAAVAARNEASAEEDGVEEARERDEEEEEDEEDDDPGRAASPGLGFGNIDSIRKALFERRHELHRALSSISVAGIMVEDFRPSTSTSSDPRMSTGDAGVSWDDARLVAVLESLLEAPEHKRAASVNAGIEASSARLGRHSTICSFDKINHNVSASDEEFRTADIWKADIAKSLLSLGSKSDSLRMESSEIMPLGADQASIRDKPSKIIHLRDLVDIGRTSLGNTIVRRIVRLARKRRLAGEKILVVGTSAMYAPRIEHADMLRWLSDAKQRINLPFRHLVVPPVSSLAAMYQKSKESTPPIAMPTYGRITEINLRHIESMLQRLRPKDSIDLSGQKALEQMGEAHSRLGERVLSQDSVQRIALAAIGLAKSHVSSKKISAVHVSFAFQIVEEADKWADKWAAVAAPAHTSLDEVLTSNAGDREKEQLRMAKLKKQCNSHEAKLLAGVVDAQNIKVGFEQVHAPAETIEALKTLTSLSLTRPDAFKYGILAQDRLTGLMLYGPPGTGKTLLAKAVAKECKATVLEVSGAQIYDKYVGEGEKMVKAVFSLAKKLSPCIVFIDEADAIFGSRSNAGNRNTHREIINQFLREWDGMDLHNVFIMVATNRPFDVDDAVLRRLPRRLLVDLPVAKDRESILKIHLRDEQLDPAVSLSELAEKTAFYSGSDLKNLCVAAALACVREESALAASHSDDPKFKLPEKRTLCQHHFDKAVKEISASISEDMSSLTAIRKFDEQYGDGRGKKKKPGYGFGIGDVAVDELAVRVRQQTPPL
jgi:SpoVK/Ycf46/Vps4 family AAA+-type ATPase